MSTRLFAPFSFLFSETLAFFISSPTRIFQTFYFFLLSEAFFKFIVIQTDADLCIKISLKGRGDAHQPFAHDNLTQRIEHSWRLTH